MLQVHGRVVILSAMALVICCSIGRAQALTAPPVTGDTSHHGEQYLVQERSIRGELISFQATQVQAFQIDPFADRVTSPGADSLLALMLQDVPPTPEQPPVDFAVLVALEPIVPEPSAFVLISLGAGIWAGRYRRLREQSQQ